MHANHTVWDSNQNGLERKLQTSVSPFSNMVIAVVWVEHYAIGSSISEPLSRCGTVVAQCSTHWAALVRWTQKRWQRRLQAEFCQTFDAQRATIELCIPLVALKQFQVGDSTCSINTVCMLFCLWFSKTEGRTEKAVRQIKSDCNSVHRNSVCSWIANWLDWN